MQPRAKKLDKIVEDFCFLFLFQQTIEVVWFKMLAR